MEPARLLPASPVASLADYVARGGGEGISAARTVGAEVLIEELEASGLRGRGGAGFPTGTKWRTVRVNRSDTLTATVVVNGAEGEPGTFKDRTILLTDPYQVIEGALIAARVVGADTVVIALKASFRDVIVRVRSAIAEVVQAKWCDEIVIDVLEGPEEYLFGEETALLEVLAGRPPFPRIAPPYRRGADDIDTGQDPEGESGLPADLLLAGPDRSTPTPPALIDNVETLANVPWIVSRGAAWFRSVGTEKSPGTIVATVTGSTVRAGVGEVALGTPLGEVIEAIGGGARPGRRVVAVMSGVSSAVMGADALTAPISYEGLAAAGGGLGSAGFLVLDDTDDLVAVAAGASRFLAVESCGQCTPCKRDGIAISDELTELAANKAQPAAMAKLASLVATVADEARCSLASQHQAVVGSLMSRFPEAFSAHAEERAEPAHPLLVAELQGIVEGAAVLDEAQATKQPDWSHDEQWDGVTPADQAANLQT